jgi:hypothetical protein
VWGVEEPWLLDRDRQREGGHVKDALQSYRRGNEVDSDIAGIFRAAPRDEMPWLKLLYRYSNPNVRFCAYLLLTLANNTSLPNAKLTSVKNNAACVVISCIPFDA